MTERPLVSIIIPCYNHVEFLGPAIDSVMAQHYREWELIVINDGSPQTDTLREIVHRYTGRVHYIEQENRGLVAARNRALEKARGDYVVFLDADDRLLPNALDAGVAALNADPRRGFVWGGRRNIDAEGRMHARQPRPIPLPCSYASLLVTNIVGPPVSAMFRRSAVAAVGGFSQRTGYAEDFDLAVRVARDNDIFRYDELVAEYRLHGANRSGDAAQMYRSVRDLLRSYRPTVRGNPALERALRAGLIDVREQYIWGPVMHELQIAVRERRWGAVLRSAAILGFRFPGRFAAYVIRRAPARLLSSRS
ncbi:MAG: glycosyltransferase [Gemmatimonadales bacterium]